MQKETRRSKPAHVRARVLVVDDDRSLAETLADGLSERGYDAVPVAASESAKELLRDQTFDALVTDLRMPGTDGIGLLLQSKQAAPARPVIVMTAYSAVDSAVESIRQGAYHYLTKPFKVEELALFLGRALDESKLRRESIALKRALKERFALANLIGSSQKMREVADWIERIADAEAPVLILGETGTGKGLVARAIHAQSGRAAAAFVSVNCATLPEALLESELFGHVKGAFTGATANRVGLIEEADGGTLFLDEIGELAPALQAKLLNVLESRSVRALGSNRERTIDARLLAATHRNLREEVARGAFREDLLYRLEVITLELPPLRQRREDIPLLIEHFLARARERYPRSPVRGFTLEATATLLAHDWPGNVRELEHVIERIVLLARVADVGVADLPATLRTPPESVARFEQIVPMREMQKRYAQWACEQLGGLKLATAEKLQIDYKTLQKLLLSEVADDPNSRSK